MATLGNPKRYRITVPSQDTCVQEWLDAQLNMSVSIRQLIRDDIMKNGYTDVTCRSVEQGAKRGRPTNAELERREQQQQDEKQIGSVVQQKEEVVSVQQEVPVVPVRVAQQPVVQNTGYNTSGVDDVLASMLNL